jgi:hypothetical protein
MSTFTVWLAVFFLVLTIMLAILGKVGGGALSGSIMHGVGTEQPPAQQPEDGEKEEPSPAGQREAQPAPAEKGEGAPAPQPDSNQNGDR